MNAVVEHQLDFDFREDPMLSRAIRRIQQGYPLPLDTQTALLAAGYDVEALINKYEP